MSIILLYVESQNIKKVRIYCGKPYKQYRKVCGILCRITLYKDLLSRRQQSEKPAVSGWVATK